MDINHPPTTRCTYRGDEPFMTYSVEKLVVKAAVVVAILLIRAS